jgi:hypothetical protein
MNLTLINSFRGGILSIGGGGLGDGFKGKSGFDRCSPIFFSKLYLTYCISYSNKIYFFLSYKLRRSFTFTPVNGGDIGCIS